MTDLRFSFNKKRGAERKQGVRSQLNEATSFCRGLGVAVLDSVLLITLPQTAVTLQALP